ncbi:MAG: methylenetetrahydrofolate reductase, partial [Candidatus Altiarchaeota archaeon]|nr:methylenetetrahydrofolate reductase [Candidatus Altiarchaeota archaeon]
MSLRERLERGDFVITLEISPPGDSAMDEFIRIARENKVDAINVPDNQRGIPRLSSLAASKILLDNKIEPIMHLSCANRNRTEMESLILGAEALKIPNLLIMTGDHPLVAKNREAKPVFDIDSVDALRLAKEKSKLHLGAVANQMSNIEL